MLPRHEKGKVAVDLEGDLSPLGNKVEEFLHRMPAMTSVIKNALAAGEAPFKDVSIFLVHHLTAEVLGTVAALRALGCRDLVAVFVGYNTDAEAAYRPDLDDLPEDEFRCFILKSTTESGGEAEGTYSVAQSFTKAPAEDRLAYDALDQAMKDQGDGFHQLHALPCSERLSGAARSRQVQRAALSGD